MESQKTQTRPRHTPGAPTLLIAAFVCTLLTLGRSTEAAAAPHRRCESLRQIQKRLKIPKGAKLGAALEKHRTEAYRRLDFDGATRALCVLATNKRFAKHARRDRWVLTYVKLLRMQKAHRRAIKVLERQLKRGFRTPSGNTRNGIPISVEARLSLARLYSELAKKTRSKRRRLRQYKRVRAEAKQARQTVGRWLYAQTPKALRTAANQSVLIPNLVPQFMISAYFKRHPAAVSAVLRLAEAVTLGSNAVRILAATGKGTAELRRTARITAELLGRLPARQEVRLAAAKALHWFDFKEVLASIRLPPYKMPRFLWTWNKRNAHKHRQTILRKSRYAVADALEHLNSTVNNWVKVYTVIRTSVSGTSAMTRAQIQLGVIYDRAASRVATVKWPRITLLWVDMFRKLFQDPFEFLEKIKKLVFAGKLEQFQNTWQKMAKAFYRSSFRPKMNLLRGGPWQKLARRRLAYLNGTKQPRSARVVGHVESSPSARIVALLGPAKYPQPKPYVAGRSKVNLTGFASLRRPAPRPTRPAGQRPARLMPNHARSIDSWIASEQARRKDRQLFTKTVRKGDAHVKRGQRAKAMLCYRRALRLSPTNTAVLEKVGLLQSQLGNLSGALVTARKLEQLGHDKAAERVRAAAGKAAR